MDAHDLTTLARHLLERERALARRDGSALGVELQDLLDDDFTEIGAHGTRWDRASIVELLKVDAPADVAIGDFVVAPLADGLALVTYRSVRRARSDAEVALRSSIWVRRSGTWRLRFHQGTPAARRDD